ncbi:unnamed protein product [Taenia asiatica]|uniref:Secreted protein n=1 Tax=Taenia asiatica TaxID=60517 RepID=A0A0R3W4F6_TAEAS|nr:unnamed protein product [Taenia asiatica]
MAGACSSVREVFFIFSASYFCPAASQTWLFAMLHPGASCNLDVEWCLTVSVYSKEKHATEEHPTKTNCHKAVIEADAVEKCRANGHSTDWQEGDVDGSVKKERR